MAEYRGEREPAVVGEMIFPALECAIVFVVSCLAFVSFHSRHRRAMVSPPLKFNIFITKLRKRLPIQARTTIALQS